jgi:hypothetical protein
MQDVSNGLHGCTVFSKIDLVKGYRQIPVVTADIPKMAIITLFGLFEYLFTPFGLSHSAQTFQCVMDYTLDGLKGVSIHGIFSSRISGQGNAPSPLGSIFCSVSRQGSCNQFGQMCFCHSNFEIPWPQHFGGRIDHGGRSRRSNQIMFLPSGHQTIATFSQHGEFLLPFFAKLRISVAPLN